VVHHGGTITTMVRRTTRRLSMNNYGENDEENKWQVEMPIKCSISEIRTVHYCSYWKYEQSHLPLRALCMHFHFRPPPSAIHDTPIHAKAKTLLVLLKERHTAVRTISDLRLMIIDRRLSSSSSVVTSRK
jgi:hypothetical protein